MADRFRLKFLPASIKETKIKDVKATTSKVRATPSNKLGILENSSVKPALQKKATTMSKPLLPLDDPDLPPFPEHLPASQAAAAVVVTWNMQTSSDSLVGAVDAIGAHCPSEKVDKDDMFVSRVVVQGLPANHLGELRIGEDGYTVCVHDEKQCLERFVKWLANISCRKSKLKNSQDATKEENRTDGIVLLSFCGIAGRIPKLLLAIRKHKLMTQFQNVVIGLCDVNASALTGDSSTPIEIISRNVLGVDMPKTDDPAVQSRHLYRIIAQLFGRKLIGAHLPPLVRKTFTPSYVMKLSLWRFKTDHRANDLRAIVTTRVGKGVKRKRSLVKNLLALGYDYASLRKQYQALGEFIFRDVLLNNLRHMKEYRESNLTETRDVGCKTVIESVVNHFKEIQRDRLLRRAPLLD